MTQPTSILEAGAKWRADGEALWAETDTLLANPGAHDDPDSLLAVAHRAAAQRARAHLLVRAGQAATYQPDSHTPSPAERIAATREVITSTLVLGADDTWSGRRNDMRRAAFDDVRETARRLLDRLDRIAAIEADLEATA